MCGPADSSRVSLGKPVSARRRTSGRKATAEETKENCNIADRGQVEQRILNRPLRPDAGG
jgi:hypothetical protein